MLFPDKSPVVLMAVLLGLLALALLFAARDLLRQQADDGQACPRCGLAFEAQRWPRRNVRQMFHGRYTVTPVYTCPSCGEVVHTNSS